MSKFKTLVLISSLLFHNLFLTIVSCASNGPEAIDLNFNKLDTSKCDITKFSGVVSGFKLTPKPGHFISSITLADRILWYRTRSSKLSNILLYFNLDESISIVLKLLNNNQGFVELIKYSDSLVYFGLLDYFYAFYGNVTKVKPKAQVLDISDDFDKLYYNCTFRGDRNGKYRSYESNELDKFSEVVHLLETIWKSGANGAKPLYSRKVEVYETAEFNYVVVTLEDNDKLYFRYNKGVEKWSAMKQDEFLADHLKLRLDLIQTGHLAGSDRKTPAIGSRTIDLSEKHKDVVAVKSFLLDDKVVTMYRTSKRRVDKLAFYGNVVDVGTASNFLVSLIKTKYGCYYMELMPSNDDLTSPILYFQKDMGVEWKRTTKIKFFEYIKLKLMDNGVPYPKNPLTKYDITSGTLVTSLPKKYTDALNNFKFLYQTTVPETITGFTGKIPSNMSDKLDPEDENNSKMSKTLEAIKSLKSGNKPAEDGSKNENENKDKKKAGFSTNNLFVCFILSTIFLLI